MRKVIGLCVAGVLLSAVCGRAQDANPPAVTGLMGAMPLEVNLLRSELHDGQTQQVLGVTFHTGELNGRRVVLVASGVGKVNAAMVATLLLDHYRPSEVIFTGIAGRLSPDLRPGDLVLGAKTIQHDFGEATVNGFRPDTTRHPGTDKRNPAAFPAPWALLRVAEEAARQTSLGKIGDHAPVVRRGTIATGDLFVASPEKCLEIRQRCQADAVDMEGAAVAQICWQQNVPCLVIRGLSDKANATASDDMKKFAAVAAENSARLVSAILQRLATGNNSATQR